MDISEWFQNKDYNTGVQLYANSPAAKSRIVNTLKRGKSERNMAVLCRELRLLKKKKANPAPVKKQPNPVLQEIKPPVSPSIQQEHEIKQQKEQAAKKYFGKIRYGDLPNELRPRFKKLKDLFYEMQDLKFALNDLRPKQDKEALKVMLAIETLDEEKETIWKEIDHWKQFKTLLPTDTGEDFSKLTPQQLFLKKASIASSISKMNKRLEGWKTDLEKENDAKTAQEKSRQISRTERKVHVHELNFRKVEALL